MPSTRSHFRPLGKPRMRARLQHWQDQFGQPNVDPPGLYGDLDGDDIGMRRFGNVDEVVSPYVDRPGNPELGTSLEAEDVEGLTLPGSLAELIRFSAGIFEPILAVVVRRVVGHFQCYTMHGKWVQTVAKNIQFTIPDFASHEEINEIAPYIPLEINEELLNKAQIFDLSVPRTAGASVVTKLTNFYDASEEVYRLNASKLDDVHGILAHEVNLRFGSLDRIARNLRLVTKNPENKRSDPDSEIGNAELYAVRKALIRSGVGITYDNRSHRRSSIFQIKPKSYVKGVEDVVGWLREYNESRVQEKGEGPAEPSGGARIVSSFAATARKFVDKNRQRREPAVDLCIGPSKEQRKITAKQHAVKVRLAERLSPTESKIVHFMQTYAFTAELLRHPRIIALAPTVLRAVDRTDSPERGFAETGLLLQEMGVVPPYVNPVLFDEHLLLPAMNLSKQLTHLTSLLEDMKKSEDAGFKDVLADIRRDWGDLPVFCIDSANAEEIDDGLSVERIPGNDSEYWIHVHIANPTAFFQPSHAMAKLAAHMTATVYLPEITFPMLPKWATQDHFSLGPGRPSMTFSARVNDDCDILEKKIQPGYVRKVFAIDHEELQHHLGLSQQGQSKSLTFTVGGELPAASKRERENLPAHAGEDLRLLARIARARRAKRETSGGKTQYKVDPEITVRSHHDEPGLPSVIPKRDRVYTFKGDPVIQARFWGSDPASDDGGKSIVSEMMMLACETAAGWCSERRVPMLYRSVVAHMPDAEMQRIHRDIVPRACDADGYPTPYMAYKLKFLGGRGKISTTPRRHIHLGVDMYAKVTSPLRRYGDMLAHWQIQTALLAEARAGHSLQHGRFLPSRAYPFPQADLENILLRLGPRERLVHQTELRAVHMWVCLALHRALHFGQAALPPSFTLCVVRVDAHRAVGFIEELHMRAEMPRHDNMDTPRLGDRWDVELKHILLSAGHLAVHAVRLRERNEEHAAIYESLTW